MTKEEIKEAIASTIVENGQKGITATALANLLNEIVDAAGSGGGGGGTGSAVENIFTLTAKINMDTGYESFSEPNEVNALIRQKIIENISNNIGCTLHIAIMQEHEEGTEVHPMEVLMYYYVDGMLIISSEGALLLLNEDGSISIEE